MTTLTSPTKEDRAQKGPGRRRLDLTALTGALFVLGVVGAAIVWGSTPDGDASALAVIDHYTAHRTHGIVAAIVLAVAAVPALAFAARLRERARLLMGGSDATLPNLAFAGGVVTAMGFLGLAVIHLALADYARVLEPSAAQALNALDGDSFLLLPPGIGTLVLAGSLIAIRSPLLPTWLGWTGLPVVLGMFSPVGFFAMLAAGGWIVIASLPLYASGGPSVPEATPDRFVDCGSDASTTVRTPTPRLGS